MAGPRAVSGIAPAAGVATGAASCASAGAAAADARRESTHGYRPPLALELPMPRNAGRRGGRSWIGRASFRSAPRSRARRASIEGAVELGQQRQELGPLRRRQRRELVDDDRLVR